MTLDPVAATDVTVQYATSDGTATADSSDHEDGADYTAPVSGAELTISADQTSGTISIATGDDTVFEANETFTVTLSNSSSNAVLGTQKTATGTIENNDAASTDAALTALTITAAGSDVTLLPTFDAEDHNYRASVDNTVASVSVAAEANHRKATVAIIEGTDLAFGENTLTLRVTAEDGLTTQDYTVTVTRALPELTWESQSTLSLDEDAGEVELTVTLMPASSDQVTVDYTTLAAGTVEGEDYTQASGTLTFAVGETQKTITVTILDDTLYEPVSVGGILVELSNATGTAVLGGTTVYLQIQDNDSPPAATMENVTVDEGAGTMVFTLSLAHGIDTDIEYRANANAGEVGGTAKEGADYAPFFSDTGVVKLGVPARQTSATFAVTILDDDVHEDDESLTIEWRYSGLYSATSSVTATGTIRDNDTRGITVSKTALEVDEDETGTYTVVLTSAPTADVTVTPSRGSGDADVTVSGPLTFTALNWNVAQTVTVSAASDADAVDDTATIEHAVVGGDYGANSVTANDVAVTVNDDELPPALVLNVAAITGDDTINIVEKAAGFTISGNTGSEGGVSVTVTVGTTDLPATSASADPATWSVSVPSAASYITGTSVDVTVSAAKTGFTSPSAITRTLAVDLTAPTVPSYTAPSSLKVGEAIAAMSPTGGAGIDEYSATGLPSGLSIDPGTGVISGTPDTAEAGTASVTVTVADTAGNSATFDIVFPAVGKGDQTLSGFQYSASSVAFGSTAPTVTAPGGAQTTLEYSATPSTVCTVNATTGALTIVGIGSCEITATAASTATYNEATATFTVTVQAVAALVLNVAAITGDDTINIAEKAAGFDDLRQHRFGGRRVGHGDGGHHGSAGDLGLRRPGDLVGERAVGGFLHHRHERGRDRVGRQDRVHLAERDHPHAGGGSDGADGAELHGAVVVEGG